MPTQGDAGSRVRRARCYDVCWRAAVLAFGWWALTEGDLTSLLFGLPVVAAATAVSVLTSARATVVVRPRGLVTLAGAFLLASVRGGWDVARRALSPRLPISPGLIGYTTALEGAGARALFAILSTLMPGTLTASISGRELEIHVLAARGDEVVAELRALEALVARALGESHQRDEVRRA